MEIVHNFAKLYFNQQLENLFLQISGFETYGVS